MELGNVLTILWRRKWVILITLLITLLVIVVGTRYITPRYEAVAIVRVPTVAQGSPDQLRYDITYADRLMNTYVRIATSGPVMQELAAQLAPAFVPQVKAELVANTELLQITVTDTDPNLAANAANKLAEIFIAHVEQAETASGQTGQQQLSEQLVQMDEEIKQARKEYETLVAESPQDTEKISAANRILNIKEDTYASLLTLYERTRASQGMRSQSLSVVEPAAVPSMPSFPRLELNLILGALLGLCGGLALAFLLENLDARLHSTEQVVSACGLSVLGEIPTARSKRSVMFANNDSATEAVRLLRTNLLHVTDKSFPRILLFTSPEPHDGKSTLAANLANALAQADARVLVIDMDLRVPVQHRLFGLTNEIGLSTVLQRKITLEQAIRKTNYPGVSVLTSGPIPENPTELLGLPLMQELLEKLAQNFDTVLLDAPVLLGLADAALLAPKADMVLLVVARGQTRPKALTTAHELLVNNRAKQIGVVVNHARAVGTYYYAKRSMKPYAAHRMN